MHTDLIKKHRACAEGLAYAKNHPDTQTAWDKCERGDWMLWLIRESNPGEDMRRPLVELACDIVETALKFTPKGEYRPRIAIEATRRWLRGDASAADAAYAAYAASAYASAYAAYAASAYASAYAAAYAAAADAARKEQADIIRRHFPQAPILD